MTDTRFCRKIINEAIINLIKTQQALDEDELKNLNGVYIPYPKKAYERIKRLLKQINQMSNNFQIEITDDERKEIHIIIK